MKRLIRDNRGAALVELALTAPILLLVTIGAAELGRLAYCAIEVESAARAGASYGAVNVNNFANLGNIEQAAYNDAPNIKTMTATATQACVCETYSTSSGVSFNPTSGTTTCSTFSGTACDTDTATTLQSVIYYSVVDTTATVPTMFNFHWRGLGLPSSFTVKGHAELRVLQN